jgi:DNA polymerase-3 subunit delta
MRPAHGANKAGGGAKPGGESPFEAVRNRLREAFRALDAGESRAVYLLGGGDHFQRETALRRLLAKLLPEEFRATSLRAFDGESAGARRVASELEASGFSFDDSPRRVVLLRDARFTPEEAEPLVARLEAGLMPDLCLVVEVRGNLDRRTRWFKAFEAAGEVLDFPALANEEDAGRLLAPRADRAGKIMTRSAIVALVERCGLDAQRLINEVEKLIAYTGGRDEITVDDVRAMVAATAELSVFDLVDAVAARQPRQALAQLEGLLAQQADVFMILAMLTRQFRLLLQARYLLDAKLADPRLVRQRPFEFQRAINEKAGGESRLEAWKRQTAGVLPAGGKQALLNQHYFPLFKSLEAAQHFTTPALAAAMERLWQTDLALKSTHLEPETELELLVTDLCTRLQHGATIDFERLLEP